MQGAIYVCLWVGYFLDLFIQTFSVVLVVVMGLCIILLCILYYCVLTDDAMIANAVFSCCWCYIFVSCSFCDVFLCLYTCTIV